MIFYPSLQVVSVAYCLVGCMLLNRKRIEVQRPTAQVNCSFILWVESIHLHLHLHLQGENGVGFRTTCTQGSAIWCFQEGARKKARSIGKVCPAYLDRSESDCINLTWYKMASLYPGCPRAPPPPHPPSSGTR